MLGDAAAAGRNGHGVRPLVVAHRGAWGAAPQNSLAALEHAVELGCDGIEIDVRRTGDGRMVLVHDARLRWRTISRLNHDRVQARMQAGQAPLLEDVLSAAAGRIIVDVELKEDGYVGEAVATINRHLTPDQHVVTSFRPKILAQVRHHAPQSRTGLLVLGRARPKDLRRGIDEAQPDFLAPHVSLARSGVLDRPHDPAADLGLWVWTVNDPRSLQVLSRHPRVHALITDHPKSAQNAVDMADSRE